MDSLADVISFGLAPAVLAFAWGVQFIDPIIGEKLRGQIFNAGYFIAFLFLLCGACRLARFNVQMNPDPQEPRPPRPQVFRRTPDSGRRRHGGRRGLGQRCRTARVVAALRGVAGAAGAARLPDGEHLALLQLQGNQPEQSLFAADHYSGRRVHLRHVELRRSFCSLAMATAYVASGIVIRIGGILRRRLRHAPPPAPEIKIA